MNTYRWGVSLCQKDLFLFPSYVETVFRTIVQTQLNMFSVFKNRLANLFAKHFLSKKQKQKNKTKIHLIDLAYMLLLK